MKLKRNAMFLVLLFTITNVFSDIIKRSDGSRLVGTMLSASVDSIKFMLEDSTVVDVPKNIISAITFSSSDELLLYPANIIRCKIIQEIPPYIIYVNAKGLYRVHQSQIVTTAFNSSGKLKVKRMPETGAIFKSSVFNRKPPLQYDRLFIGLSMNIFHVQAKDWKKDFYYNQSDFLLFSGAVLGYKLKNNFTPSIGFEMSIRDLKREFPYESHFQLNHLFAGLKYPCSFGLDTKLRLVPAFHVGACAIKGNAFTYSFREYLLDEVKMTLRAQLGIDIPIAHFIKLNLSAAYLFMPEVKFARPSDALMKDPSLNFSGISFQSRIDFYPPDINLMSK